MILIIWEAITVPTESEIIVNYHQKGAPHWTDTHFTLEAKLS